MSEQLMLQRQKEIIEYYKFFVVVFFDYNKV